MLDESEDSVIEPAQLNDFSPGNASSQEIADRPNVKAAFEKIEREMSGPSEAPKPTNGRATARKAQERRQTREAEEVTQVQAQDQKKKSRQSFQESAAAQPAAIDQSPTEEADGEATVGQEPAGATLPPVLRHSAHRAGLSDEEIDALWAENPERATQEFQRYLRSFNEISTQFARLGQQRLQGNQPQQQQQAQPQRQQRQQPPQQQPSGDPLDELFSEESLAELSQSEGQIIVDRVLRPLQQHLVGPVRQMQAHVQRMVEREQRMHEESLRREVVQTFDGLEKDYGDMLGSMKKGLSNEQKQARGQVLQVADAILEGHRAQGLELTIRDAMDRALAMVVAPRLAEIERTNLRKQVQKRQSGFTARPTQRRVAQVSGEGADRSDSTAIEAYSRRAAELGMSLE